MEHRPVVAITAGQFAASSGKTLGHISVRFVSIHTLIRMKEAAGRTQDKLDIAELRALYPDHDR